MKKLLILVGLISVMLSCRKDPDLGQLSDDFIVATFYDRSANFDSLKTYFIPSQVGYISNVHPNDTLLAPASASQLVNRVKNNMNQRGFIPVDSTANPDMAVNMFVIRDLNRTDVISPGGWWGYPGYYDPWYYGYYDSYYYYPFSYSYTYETGTLVIELIDLKNSDSNNNKLIVVWNAISNGVLAGYQYGQLQEGLDAIDQSFAQSPYLVTR
ncbi:MAG: DUF4136 domain-containing protein [Bacteroidota bacterium]